MPTFTFRIGRSDAKSDKIFTVEVEPRMTVLDGLFLIQREQDPSLSFRCSCRVGMCGTCAMMINWQPRLACQTRLVTLKSDVIVVEPLAHLPVLKDLIISLEPFFNQWRKVRPALHPKDKTSKKLAVVRPDSEFGEQAAKKWDCITCGACYAACSITGSNSRYLGPAAINKGLLRLLDPRDGFVDERLEVLNSEKDGVWRCHTQFNCVAACPKGINLTDSIVRLKRAMGNTDKFHNKVLNTQ